MKHGLLLCGKKMNYKCLGNTATREAAEKNRIVCNVSTLSWWWGLSAPKTLRAMPAVAYLLVGSPMPDRSRGRSQTKRDILVLQVGGWA
jgi:hypothetical protein